MIGEFLIQDRDNHLLGTLVSKECLIAKRDWKKNGFHTFEMSVPSDHRYAKVLIKGNRIMFKDTDRDKWYEFEISRENTKVNERSISAESAYYDTLSCFIPFVDITGNTAINGLTKILNTAEPKSRWQAGTSDIEGSFYMQRTRKSLKETIAAWVNTCGGVISERIEFYNGQIKRYIDILSTVGSDRGKVIYDDREINDVDVTVPERTNYTMAFGYGKPEMTTEAGDSKPITFADVVWSVSSGDPVDKPKGQTWVALPDVYRQRFGLLDANGDRQHRCTEWNETG
ncbi:MAG: phage tail spike protein, partial [Eubacterium sp.]